MSWIRARLRSSARKAKPLSRFLQTWFGEGLDLRVQSFNVLAFTGMTAGIIIAIISVAQKTGPLIVLLNLFAAALAVCMLRVAGKKVSYRICGRIIVLLVFIVLFPLLFFMSGGYRSGMPCFFVFAILFTTIMLEGRDRAFALVTEFILYIGCCFVSFYFPGMVTTYPKEIYYVGDVATGIVISGALLMLVVLLHTRMNTIQQAQINELNRDLAAKNETLIRYDRMKSDFLAAVAHEIRTPLDVIVASSQDALDLLEETPLNMTEIAENHAIIKRRAMKINRIVMDLADIVAIENGRLTLSRDPVYLADMLRMVCNEHFFRLDVNQNRIVYDFQPDLPRVWIDPERIEQVMMNLISNAVRHTKDGIVAVTLTQADGRQVVGVTDNGEGMDARVVQTALAQYAPSSKSEYWRHGIGLYICRQIIVSHNGEIWIESEKGLGTTVSFSLREEQSDG